MSEASESSSPLPRTRKWRDALSMSSSRASVGGRSALAGYLYQMLGVLGIQAWAQTLEPDSSTSPEFTAFLRLVNESQLVHEQYDQDAVLERRAALEHVGLREDDTCVLVQMKYSKDGDASTIGPDEFFNDIIRAFRASTKAALANQQQITGYVLITNRRIGPDVDIEALQRAAQNGGSHPRLVELDRPILHRLRHFTT